MLGLGTLVLRRRPLAAKDKKIQIVVERILNAPAFRSFHELCTIDAWDSFSVASAKKNANNINEK
jgi:hypothetical protein